MFSDWEDVTSSGRAFQVFAPATEKARLPTVDRLTGGTRRRLVPVERSEEDSELALDTGVDPSVFVWRDRQRTDNRSDWPNIKG